MVILLEETNLERNPKNLSHIPHSAGVYVFREGLSAILIIGATEDLRADISRILQQGQLNSCEHCLRKHTTSFDYYVTGAKLAAYQLEKQLLFEHDGFKKPKKQKTKTQKKQ
jgi:excinuclease UvrABC nuclease subunit